METMEEVDDDTAQDNKLELTLDEIIALKKIKEEKEEEEKQNALLRARPGFGSLSIHSRLGYGHYNVKKPKQNAIFKHNLAQNSIKKAKVTYWKKNYQFQKPDNIYFSFRNNNSLKRRPFITPLTRNSVSEFNKNNNSGYVRRENGSVFSRSSRPSFHRHSARTCLSLATQAQIKRLEQSDVDIQSLETFNPTVDATDTTNHIRFSLYI